jgi:transcriptional regulator with XRE-family HTH domain
VSARALVPVDTLTYAVPKSQNKTSGVPDRYRNAVAGFIKRLLADGLTQRELSERLGVSQPHLSQLMQGARSKRGLGLPVVLKLHDATKASIDEILGIRSDVEERLARVEAQLARKDTPPPTTTVRRSSRPQ